MKVPTGILVFLYLLYQTLGKLPTRPRFRQDVGEDFLDTIIELKELVDVHLLNEFTGREPVVTKIDELRRKLEGSAI